MNTHLMSSKSVVLHIPGPIVNIPDTQYTVHVIHGCHPFLRHKYPDLDASRDQTGLIAAES